MYEDEIKKLAWNNSLRTIQKNTVTITSGERYTYILINIPLNTGFIEDLNNLFGQKGRMMCAKNRIKLEYENPQCD